MATKFYKCPICGNVIVKHVDSQVVPVCCGKPMQLLDPHLEDGAAEKHLPVVTRRETGELLVKVGEVPHPMQPEHHICFVAVETEKGLDVHYLKAGDTPEALCCDALMPVTAVYEYCNLHGLWMTTDIPPRSI
ncbi:MAG: hypothetical protein MJZ43_05800 [Bacteroidaceae bacterium]|nr:hypothetical protein [Candidatus Equimonas faecalis]MCQ2206271.1 hypothetical protein [Bacteroidaceae bacterium]